MELLAGANAVLPAGPISVEVTWGDGAGLDVYALLLGSRGTGRGDADLVFVKNPESEAGAVRLAADRRAARVDVDVDAEPLPADIERIAIVAAVDVDAPPGTTFARIAGLRAAAVAGGQTFTFAVPNLVRGETAAVLVELYRRGDDWKIRAVGQGYASGLAGLAADFGIGFDIGADAVETASPVPAPGAETPDRLPAVAGPAAQPALSGRRIHLAKGASTTISLDKNDASGVVTATLEWDGGSEERHARGADLDLYALYIPAHEVAGASATTIARSVERRELSKAKKRLIDDAHDDLGRGAVYWNNLGSPADRPYIALDGDAVVPGVETVRITHPDKQGFVLICAYSAVGNGDGSFKSYGAKAVVSDGRGAVVTAPLYHDHDMSFWVAIALVDFTVPGAVAIHHVETYSRAARESRPVLFPDGSFVMDEGPEEFKPTDYGT